jgi:hypothetical protein
MTMPISVAAPGIYPGLEDHVYRSLPAISHSELKRWVKGEEKGQEKDSRRLLLGRALDTLLLQPKLAAELYTTLPEEVNLTTKEGKRILADHEAKTGKRAIRPSERNTIKQMVASLRDHAEAKKFLDAPGEAQLVVVSDLGAVGGQLSKGLIDKRCRKCLVDIKHTGYMDEKEFLNQIYDYGYDSQGAHYIDLMAAHVKEFLPLFLVCVSKRSYKTWIHRITPEQYATGRRWYRDMLRLYSTAHLLAPEGTSHAA